MTISPTSDTPVISVVICTYNHAALLANTLQALADQVEAPPFEVIVVDDGSADDPASVVEPFITTGSLDLVLITLAQNEGQSFARNTGWNAARAEIIAFTDADCLPPPNWLKQLWKAWAAAPESVHGIGGLVRPAEVDTLARRFVKFRNTLAPLEIELAPGATMMARVVLYLSLRPAKTGPRAIFTPVGANMSFRKTTLAAIGGFDPGIRFGGDEMAVTTRIWERYGPGSIQLDPDVVIAHDFGARFGDVLRRSRAYGRGSGRNFAAKGGHAELRPVPILLFFALIAEFAAFRPRPKGRGLRRLLFLIIIPAIVWRRAFTTSVTSDPMAVVFPMMATIEESAAMVGFAEGWLRESNRARKEGKFSGE